ncbi:MAG: SMC-Scp complex subunit ScpB [Oscillospiraceae bacterium]|nr:SMC-Scp complex subunit ScpB [Oscillospiraceae bacterium]
MEHTPETTKNLSLPMLHASLEAVLFATGHPLTYGKLANLFDNTPGEIKGIIHRWAEEYNAKKSGLMIAIYPDSCQLCTREEYGAIIRTALGVREGASRLSAANLEVLSAVAYHQPTTRAYVEQLRGVDCSHAISVLVDRGFIESKSRLDVPGRPRLYTTTTEFLRCFGLNSLSELPKVDGEV